MGANNGSESGLFFSTLANPDLKWETQASTDVALEFTLFGRLSGTVEYFRKDSKDLIFNVSIPASNGVRSTARNIGKIRNSGVEVNLNWNILRLPDWKLDFGVNLTYLKNQIVSLPEENRAEGIISGSKKRVEGGSIYQFWLRQWWGVDPSTGDGLYVLDTDLLEGSNADAILSTVVELDDRMLTNNYAYAKYDYSGNSNPDVYGGFHFHIGWKNFDLTTTFSYQLGGQILDNIYRSMMSLSDYGTSMHADTKKAWRQIGDVTDVPRLDSHAVHATNIGQDYSTRWLVSSDYLNLRSISLSYNLPKALLQKVEISSARITLNAENLFMLKKRQGLNPMANYTGLTYNEYLPSRIFSAALQFTF
ncbi:MAG: TonB-dependent receptor [Rikenellaceae bacterium]|nr:TonB-dependent receptor [Rikenellaceae bacterium]